MDDDEDEDEEEDEDSDSEATSKDVKLAEKATKVRDANQVLSSFEAHEIHHFVKGISASYWNYGNFEYHLD